MAETETDRQVSNVQSTYQVRRHVQSAYGRVAIILWVLLGFAIVQGYRYGYKKFDYVFIIVAAILLYIFLSFYYVVVTRKIDAPAESQWAYSWKPYLILGGGGTILVFFFLYIILYRGLWSLATLTGGFALKPLLKAVIFVLLGYSGVNWFFELEKVDKFLNRANDAIQKYGN